MLHFRGLRPRIYLVVFENDCVGGSVVVSGECQHGVSRGGEKEWNDGRGEYSDSVLPSFIPLRGMPARLVSSSFC